MIGHAQSGNAGGLTRDRLCVAELRTQEYFLFFFFLQTLLTGPKTQSVDAPGHSEERQSRTPNAAASG